MNQEQFVSVVREDNNGAMATIDDFVFEELEDRLEQVTCWLCVEDGGRFFCVRVPCA